MQAGRRTSPVVVGAIRAWRRLGRWRCVCGLALVSILGCLALGTASAGAEITNLVPGDPSTDTPEFALTDDMGLEAIGESTVRGGIICVVDAATTDPGDNSLTCDHPAFGGAQNYIGLGSFFMPLVPPSAMLDGTYRLLGDGDAGGSEPDTLSPPFTVSPCAECNPAPVEDMFQAWKDAAKPLAADGAIACALFNTEGDKSKLKLGTALVENSITQPPNWVAIASAVGGFAFANLTDEAPEMTQLDKWLGVMNAVTCRAAAMYQDIVNDPPDPNYQSSTPPQFGVPMPVSDEQTQRLSLSLDEIRANGEAELTAAQRFEGAQNDNSQEWMGTQAQLVASYGQALASEMSDAAGQFTAFADRLQAAGVGGDPLTQAEADAAASFTQRIHDSGFTQDEVDQMTAAGLDGAAQQDLQTTWGSEPSAQPAVGISLQQALRTLAADFSQRAADEAEFAAQFADYPARGQAPALKAVITPSVTTPQLAPYAARFSATDSTPGTSPIVSYHWDFGDGATDDGVETSHLYSTPGIYNVTLTVTDADGNTASSTYQGQTIDRSALGLPICQDAGGNIATQCDGFDQLQPGSAFTVAGSGPQEVKIQFAFRGGAWNNSLVWFPVDDAAGTIDGLNPGQPGWLTAAESRMRTAFDGSLATQGDEITLPLQGGQHFALGLVTDTSLDLALTENPLNQAGTTGFDLQFTAANQYHSIQALPYRRQSDGMIQLGFEDIPGDASDYTDNVYDISNVTQSTPAEVSTSVTADQSQVSPGGADGYELKVLNVASGATVLDSLSDTLPAGFSYVPGSTRGATTADPQISGQTLTWSGRFTAPGGGVAGVHFSVRAASAAGTYLDQGSADAGGIPVTSSGAGAPVTVAAPGSQPPKTSPAAGSPPAGSSPTPRPLAPLNIGAPAITGTGRSGHTLTCSTGSWTHDPTRFSYQWNRFETPLAGAIGSTYRVQTLDEGSPLTCSVNAANAAGQATATSPPVTIATPQVKGCPAATGNASSNKLGLAALGMTRAQTRRAYTHSSNRGRRYEDFFCLTPIGIRVGYASPKLLVLLPRSQRRQLAGHVVWASTSNPHYAVDGIRPGATLLSAEQRAPRGNLFHVGLNYWYVAALPSETVIFKVRRGVVEEVGIANPRVTQTKHAQQVFVKSFS